MERKITPRKTIDYPTTAWNCIVEFFGWVLHVPRL